MGLVLVLRTDGDVIRSVWLSLTRDARWRIVSRLNGRALGDVTLAEIAKAAQGGANQ